MLKIPEPKMDEVTGGWGNYITASFLICTSHQIQLWYSNRRGTRPVWMAERCIQGFVGKLDGKRPLGRPRRKWQNNIKADLGQT
jgi:hypothetical protein